MSLLETIKNLLGKITAAPTPEETPAEVKTSKPVEVSDATPVVEKTVVYTAPTGIQVPEDSTLKRHFISALKCDIESEMTPRPTESTLKRHYDSTVQAKLEDLLG